MTQPSDGITPEIIRDIMPPYHLSQDLLAATLATIAPPPPDASETWRHTHLTRLISEIVALHPADAAQARIAAQILGIRELADTITARAQAEASTLKDLCRVARSTAELLRSASTLERTLNRRQQKPVPFYGTVIQDDVDLKTLDAQWASRTQSAAAPERPPATKPHRTREASASANPPPTPPTDTPPRQATAHTPASDANPPAPPTATPRPPKPTARPAPASPPHTRPAAPGSDWMITTLDSGPGWTREVLRHRSTVAAPAEAAE